jgi:NAD(P)-dependent dehydrogenase (short-subunit alcohol dehydrogenase family)
MTVDLQGRRALVTGSTAGIGFAIVQALVRAGASVIINGRNQETVGRAVARLLDTAPEAAIHGVAADAGSAEGAARLIAHAPDVDVLVNSLGIFEIKTFFEIDDPDWRHLFEVNVLSGVRLSRHYALGMRARGWGRVIFISSESGLNIPRNMIHYGMTKTAQLAVSRGLATEMAGSGVTVNAVLPGPTRSEGVERLLHERARIENKDLAEVEAAFFRAERPTSLIRRFAEPEEVANLVAYIASPLSSATTGAALRVDGGVVNCIA